MEVHYSADTPLQVRESKVGYWVKKRKLLLENKKKTRKQK